jgi:hypothetical protein
MSELVCGTRDATKKRLAAWFITAWFITATGSMLLTVTVRGGLPLLTEIPTVCCDDFDPARSSARGRLYLQDLLP